ncbi:hypothetical protein NM688_g2913 [Phlebia brevispora]|uniref:Uncharacterized protein n=1 Tax=Phlebia brevispora TaxID=194682 RepID=A0ACC1T753_9APHY|nr:hypothetical protein NM688_g2913 [Phlebia brevispora]
MTARISLAQQIALLSETAPTDFDPEDINHNNAPSDDEQQEITSIGAREHYINVGPSTLRQINQASVSDPKYDGKRVSRKQLLEDEDEEVLSGGQGSDGEPPEGSESEEEGEEEEGQDEESDSPEGDGGEDGIAVPSRVRFAVPESPSRSGSPAPRKSSKRPPEGLPEDSENQDLTSTLRATREQDRKKGKAVAQQISLWDTLLDARIRLQKAASAVNRLPAAQNSEDNQKCVFFLDHWT